MKAHALDGFLGLRLRWQSGLFGLRLGVAAPENSGENAPKNEPPQNRQGGDQCCHVDAILARSPCVGALLGAVDPKAGQLCGVVGARGSRGSP